MVYESLGEAINSITEMFERGARVNAFITKMTEKKEFAEDPTNIRIQYWPTFVLNHGVGNFDPKAFEQFAQDSTKMFGPKWDGEVVTLFATIK